MLNVSRMKVVRWRCLICAHTHATSHTPSFHTHQEARGTRCKHGEDGRRLHRGRQVNATGTSSTRRNIKHAELVINTPYRPSSDSTYSNKHHHHPRCHPFVFLCLSLSSCLYSLEVTVTSLHPPRLCRIAVFSIKPTFLSAPL